MVFNVATIDYLPSTKDVLNIPLPKFITFLANDCGYTITTSDLTVISVNIMFLKANTE